MSPQEIKSARLSLCLTQKGLGEKLGVSEAAVCNWEKGYRNPSKSAVKLIGIMLLEDTAE